MCESCEPQVPESARQQIVARPFVRSWCHSNVWMRRRLGNALHDYSDGHTVQNPNPDNGEKVVAPRQPSLGGATLTRSDPPLHLSLALSLTPRRVEKALFRLRQSKIPNHYYLLLFSSKQHKQQLLLHMTVVVVVVAKRDLLITLLLLPFLHHSPS